MTDQIVVFGHGAVGRAVTLALLARGDGVRVAQRTRPEDLPSGVEFVTCDLLDAAAVRRAMIGAGQAVLAVGFAYDAAVWRRAWPATIGNVIAACAEVDARVVFLDNLYQLGRQTGPRHEEMTLTSKGAKPSILAAVTRTWMKARDRVRFTALRAPDFYGPGVPVSYLGATGLAALAAGKSALVVGSADTPHDFAYVPDIARAILDLLDAPDDAYGQVWNMPCAPTQTLRQLLNLGAVALDVKPRIMAVPLWLLRPLGLFVPFLREVADVAFTWDSPYAIDGRKFSKRFDFKVTPYEVGVPATALWFRADGGEGGRR